MTQGAANLFELFKSANSGLRKDASSNGGTIFSALGLNAVNLEQQAKSLVPYNAPFLNSTPRTTSDVGGLTVQWKAVLNASPGIVSLAEVNRAASATLLEKDYSAPFKTMGVEVDVSMFAQETGRGFQDNIGFAQFSALQMFLRAQDQQILCDGNSGTAGNGYALATALTPVVALVAGGSITASTNVSAFVVLLTPYGLRAQNDSNLNPSFGTGLTPQLSATNMNGLTIHASGGTSIVSAASNVVVTDSGHKSVSVTVGSGANGTFPFGAVAMAVYLDSTDASAPALANGVFVNIFNTSTVTISALPSGSNQKANAAGLSTDYSFDTNNTDSYYAWAVNWSSQGASPSGNYSSFADAFYDQGGAALTAVGDGSIQEFSTAAQLLYNKYKSAPDRILIAAQTTTGKSLKEQVQSAIVGTSFGSANAGRLIFESKDGQIVGGTKQIAYEWPYSYDGISKVITVEVMPWLPAGVIVFETTQNPYPQAAGRIPAAFEVHSLLETFGIMWPITKLQREYGTYGFLATKAYLPHVAGVIQNIGG